MGGIERGERDLSFKKLSAIAAALGRDVGSLTRGPTCVRAGVPLRGNKPVLVKPDYNSSLAHEETQLMRSNEKEISHGRGSWQTD
jgi:hypothetical protein